MLKNISGINIYVAKEFWMYQNFMYEIVISKIALNS